MLTFPSLKLKSRPRLLTQEQINALRDQDLLRWYRKLWVVRNSPADLKQYNNIDRVFWCFHEARRQLVARGIKNYDVEESNPARY